MKPVAVIVGILLLLLIVGMCCTPKSYSDSDSNSSSEDSSNTSVAKGLGKTLDTGRMGYKYEDKMCVAVKDAPNEHANPPIYDSLMNCYIHHMPLGFKWIDGKCKAVAVEPNGVDVFTTEEECKNRHKKLGPDGKPYGQYGFKWVGDKCEAVLEEPNGKDVFLTEDECYRHKKLGPHGKDNHPYGPGGIEDAYKLVYDGKEEECIKVNKPIDHKNVFTEKECQYRLENGYGPHRKGYHKHTYGPNGKHHEHPYGPDGLEDGYKLFYDGKEECIKVNKPIDNVNVLTKEVCEYKLKNGYGPHGKGFNPDGPHGKGYRPDLKPHPGHDECACEKNQYIMINSN
jgi:ubiquitin